jgi:predicted DNA-binding transcriptional regulator AlpA
MKLFDCSDQGREPKSELLREPELAARWKTSRRTLQRWRADGTGPAWLHIGGAIRYRASDIEAFEDRMRRGGQSSRVDGEQ